MRRCGGGSCHVGLCRFGYTAARRSLADSRGSVFCSTYLWARGVPSSSQINPDRCGESRSANRASAIVCAQKTV